MKLVALFLAGGGLLVGGFALFQTHHAARDSADAIAELEQTFASLSEQVSDMRSTLAHVRSTSEVPSLAAPVRQVTRSMDEGSPADGSRGRMADASGRDAGSGPETDADRSARFEQLSGRGKEEAIEDLVDAARWGDKKALEMILASLKDPDPSVREEAIEAIGDLGDPALLDAIKDMATDPDASVREELAEALENMPGDKAGAVLTALLSDSNSEVIEEALDALRSNPYPGALPMILQHVQGQDLDLVAEAGATLRRWEESAGAHQALERVAADLSHEDPLARISAIRRVRRVGGDGAIQYLQYLVDQDDNLTVRMEAQRALQRLLR